MLRLVLALAVGMAFLVMYLRGQKTRAQPLIDLTLFRQHEFAARVCGGKLQHGRRGGRGTGTGPAPAAGAGPVAARGGAGTAAHAPGCLRRRSHRRMAAAPDPAQGPHGRWIRIGGGLCVAVAAASPVRGAAAGIGLGIGATVTCASTTVMNAAPPQRAGMAASIEEVGFELGGAVGIAVFGTLMTLVFRPCAGGGPRCGAGRSRAALVRHRGGRRHSRKTKAWLTKSSLYDRVLST